MALYAHSTHKKSASNKKWLWRIFKNGWPLKWYGPKHSKWNRAQKWSWSLLENIHRSVALRHKVHSEMRANVTWPTEFGSLIFAWLHETRCEKNQLHDSRSRKNTLLLAPSAFNNYYYHLVLYAVVIVTKLLLSLQFIAKNCVDRHRIQCG